MGCDHRVAELVHQELHERVPARAGLLLGPAVQVDDHRRRGRRRAAGTPTPTAGAGGRRCRSQVGIAHQLRCHAASWRPPGPDSLRVQRVDAALLEVVDVDVARRRGASRPTWRGGCRCGRSASCRCGPRAGPAARSDTFRACRAPSRRLRPSSLTHVGDVAPVGADVEVLHVPADVGAHQPAVVRHRVLELQLHELAVLVGEHVHAAPAGSNRAVRIPTFFGLSSSGVRAPLAVSARYR